MNRIKRHKNHQQSKPIQRKIREAHSEDDLVRLHNIFKGYRDNPDEVDNTEEIEDLWVENERLKKKMEETEYALNNSIDQLSEMRGLFTHVNTAEYWFQKQFIQQYKNQISQLEYQLSLVHNQLDYLLEPIDVDEKKR